MRPVFQFREGCHVRGDAQVVGERLESIRAKQQALTPELVLADARAARSPLHQFFEWDDSIAAERYRLDQAGHLIRAVVVTFQQNDPEPERQVQLTGVPAQPHPPARPVRAFLAIKSEDGEPGYVGTAEAMADPSMRQQVIAKAHAELDSVSRRYRELRELSEVFVALDRVGELLRLPVVDQGQPS
jgi:hypothetical protein